MLTPIPDRYLCPISLRIMGDPVAVHHGGDADAGRVAHIYSRQAIDFWTTHRPTCPLDERPIVRLIPQPELQREIRDYVVARGNDPAKELDAPLRAAYADSIENLVQEEIYARRDLGGEAEIARLGILCPFVIKLPAKRDQILARRMTDMDRWGRPVREFIGAPLDALVDQTVTRMPMTVIYRIHEPFWIRNVRVTFLSLRGRVEESRNDDEVGQIEMEIGQGALAPRDLVGFRPLSQVPSLLQSGRRPLAPTYSVTVACRPQDRGITMSRPVFLTAAVLYTTYVVAMIFFGYVRLSRRADLE